MVVILCNEADNFEEEPDFTCPDAPERCSQTITDRVPHKNVEYVVLSRAYTQGDLTPVLKDTACNPEWPLAAYWPVYVANFRATSSAEQTVFKEVSHFFAYNGLLTRMILLGKHYGGEAFQKYQEDSMLFDMLVYFVSKEDADRAIATCHQVSYYGYKLTVLPGRIPIYYDEKRSVRIVDVAAPYPQERQIEEDLSKHVPVQFIGRYSNCSVGVEFLSAADMLTAIEGQRRWAPHRMPCDTMKQRFIEGQVTKIIKYTIMATPSFLDMKPGAVVLRWLLEGYRPFVNLDWRGHTFPVMTDANRDSLQLEEVLEKLQDPDQRRTKAEKEAKTVLGQIQKFKAYKPNSGSV